MFFFVIEKIIGFFGNVVFWFGIVGVLLVVVTMISYRIRRKNEHSAQDQCKIRIALITGASSGIGRAFAMEIDQKETGIDEIWLVARRQEKLDELAGRLTHKTRVICADLTEGLDKDDYENALTRFLEERNRELAREQAGEPEQEQSGDLQQKQAGEPHQEQTKNLRLIRIGILVNAAGFAKIGNYANVSFRDSMRMVDLNAKAVMAATLACLPYMQRGDRIIQMCSTAAFQPLQHINIYGSSKAFLYHYSRALRLELLPRGISVTSVCPFWVKDTEFIRIAQSGGDERTGNISIAQSGEQTPNKKKPPIRHFPFATTAEAVARRGLRGSRLGWAVVTPGAFCVIHRIFTKLLPREAAIWIWELMRRI